MKTALRAVLAFCVLLLLIGVARADPKLGLELVVAPDPKGVHVQRVDPGGPAEQAGIRVGDYIVEVAQEKVTSAQEVVDKVRRAHDAGKASVLLLIDRQGDLKFLAARFRQTAAPTAPAPAPVVSDPVTLDPIGVRVRRAPPEKGRGLVITDVTPGSSAAAEALRPGDIIVEVRQEPVSTPAEAAAQIRTRMQEGGKAVLVLVDRNGDLSFHALRFAEAPATAPAPQSPPATPPVATVRPLAPPTPPVQATPRPAPAPPVAQPQFPPESGFDTAPIPPVQEFDTAQSSDANAAKLRMLKEQQARLQQAEEQRRQAEAEAQAEREAAVLETAREPFSLSRDIPASFGVIWEYVPKWVFLVAILIGAFLHQNVMLKVASGVFFFCQIALMGMSDFGFLETLFVPLQFWFVVPFHILSGDHLPGMPGLAAASFYPVLSLIGYVAAIYYVGPDTRRYEWERLRGLTQNGLMPFLKDWRERREIARERRALEQAERAAAWQQQPGYAGHPYPPPYAYPAPRTPLSEWFKTAYWAARLLILATAVIWLIWSTQEVLSMLGALLPAPLRDLFADLLGRASEMVRTPATR